MSGPRATEPAARAASRSGSLHVVELVGTAGAGKTSLLEALANSGVTIRAGFRLRKHWHVLPAFALVPTFVALHRPFRGVLWKEMKRITYLATLRHRLQEQRKGSRPVVLDEGPVYMLARLRVLGGNRLSGPGFDRWWRETIRQWAHSLDLIVWLDASDPVLRDRVRNRVQSHGVKQLGDQAVDAFMARYRAAYSEVIGALVEARGPEVLTVRTDQESLSVTTSRLLAELRPGEAVP